MAEMSDQGQLDLLERLANAFAENGTTDPAALAVPDVAGAYAVQAALFERYGRGPDGFKLSLRDGSVFSAPLLFVDNGDKYPFAAGIFVEPELALTLSKDLPPRDMPYTRDEILDAVGKVSLGVEIARSRYQTAPTWPLPLADFLSNVGYLVGVELDRSLLTPGIAYGSVSVHADDVALFDAQAKHPDNDPLAAVLAYANSTPGPLGHFKAGQVITTGSLCGAVKVPSPAAVRIAFADQEYRLRLV